MHAHCWLHRSETEPGAARGDGGRADGARRGEGRQVSEANLRRRITGLERRLSAAGTLYVIAMLWLVAGVMFFGAGVLVWGAVAAMVRAW